MKRLTAATVLAVALTLAPAPAHGHTLVCAAYVGNPCYQIQAQHAWWHAFWSNPLGTLLGGIR